MTSVNVSDSMNQYQLRNKLHSFDMDDNIFFLPTKIMYFAKDLSNPVQAVAVSTEEFAKTREKVGKVDLLVHVKNEDGVMTACEAHEGEQTLNLINFETINENDKSFQQFRDCPTKNHFLNDLKKAIASKSFGPSFNDFVESCSCPEAVKQVSIVTARGHAPATFIEAFKYLQEIGMIKHVPLEKNIYPVSYKGMPDKFRTGANTPQNAKMNVLEHLLDEKKDSQEKVFFGFSDDDKKTFDSTKAFLEAEVNKGRWPHISVNLYYTGNKKKERFVLVANEPEAA